jgi:hypothetical protein
MASVQVHTVVWVQLRTVVSVNESTVVSVEGSTVISVRDVAGGGGGRVVWQPQAAQSQGRHNEYFKFFFDQRTLKYWGK